MGRLITIVTATYFSRDHRGEERMENARASVQSWLRHLQYPEIALHVADDGSDQALWDRFCAYHQGIRITYSRQRRRGIGASLNAGLSLAWSAGMALYIQDDLLLEEDLDLSFPAAVLDAEPRIGAVRIGLPHPGTAGVMLHIGGLHRRDSMVCDFEAHHYVMSFRPTLSHPRMGYLGPYIEGETAEQTERDYNERYTMNPRLRVVQWIPNPWHHQHVVDLGTLSPALA